MEFESIEWAEETQLYFLSVNGMVNFGITSNWDRRIKAYQKELGDIEFKLIRKTHFDNRWQAELIEQVVKWRLKRWCVPGRPEWINMPIQAVLDCYAQCYRELSGEFSNHAFIHKTGEERWDYYRQIAEMYFDHCK